ncbi:MAG: 4-(cytidine 5'-diphospho)-2-C-methyl-D-erythritol kinase [Alteromonadaceae bacterium]|nr:4-(cytidine 5'-diphospho)-2-C-methyl-D-erythritol kinase [Alteromonadaceae bacterium]
MFTDKFYSFPSPAKLNLFLHIVGRRKDGYHELESIFQFLDFGDTIEIKATDNSNIELLTPIEGVDNQDNLIVKAALLLQNYTGSTFGAQIKIKKILPMGGGLGGGSSNAATVILALNVLWNTKLTNETLAEIGLSLGADVPIFIHGFAAFAQGVGEKLTQVTPEEYWYLVSKPNCSISTASVFTSVDLPRNTAKLPKNTNKNNINIELCHNDCQTMVIKHYPKVAKLLAWLVEYAPSRMTGTGACIFSRFDSAEEASRIQDKLPQGIESFVAKGSNQSQIINALNKAIKSKN